LAISDPRIDPNNPSCLSNRSGRIFLYLYNNSCLFLKKGNGTKLIYGNLTSSPKSSLTILSGSLQANQTYQFMAYLVNRKNASIQATGYVLVTVEDTYPQLIAIG